MAGKETINFYQKKAYLKFWFRSFHLHGVHSPFVFQLQQACSGQNFSFLIDYLKIETILIFGKTIENDAFKNRKIQIINPDDSGKLDVFLSKSTTFDLVYFPFSTENICSLFQKSLPLAQNNSVFIFEKIHYSQETEHVWKKIKQSKKVRVSIDTFQYGFVFFRKEQAKEDFVVRLGKI